MPETVDHEKGHRFTVFHLLLLVPWVAVVIDAWQPIRDNSFLWHIRAGEMQIEGGEVLTTDPFSFTSGGEPWLTQSWLAELLYARLEAFAGGLGFVPLMLLLVTTLVFFGIGLVAYLTSKSVTATAVILLLSTLSMISFLVPRPVIFSFLLFPVVVLGWERTSARWTLPFLFWIWASVHGSFFLGLAYVGLRLLGKREWRALPFAIGSGLATLLTAHGWGVVTMLLDFGEAREYLGLLSEWRTPELLSAVFLPVYAGLGIILWGATTNRLKSQHLWIVIPFFALALTAMRSVPPAWLALVPMVGLAMRSVGEKVPHRFGTGAMVVFAVVVGVFPFFLAEDGALDEERFPVAAAAELDEGPVFHNDTVGGYLIWKEGTERQVFIDDRAELYLDQLQRFVDLRRGSADWEPVFEEYGIDQALLLTDQPMVGWLAEAGWATQYEDDNYVVLSR